MRTPAPDSRTLSSFKNECSHKKQSCTSEQTMEFQRQNIPIEQVIYKQQALRANRGARLVHHHDASFVHIDPALMQQRGQVLS